MGVYVNRKNSRIIKTRLVFISKIFPQFVLLGSSIPQRVISAFMAFTAVALAYMLRISLSYAITQMVQMPHANINGTHDNPDVCPPYEDETTNERIEEVTLRPQSYAGDDGKYDWSQPLQGVILSSFYWGYILTHIPGGLISARVGGKYTLLLGVVIATVFTVFTPLAIQNGNSIGLMPYSTKLKPTNFVIFNFP